MKQIFTLLLSSLIGLSVFASGNAGRVSVSVYGNNNYRVFIDGRSIWSNRVYLNDLRPGRHSIEVYELKRNDKVGRRPVYSNNFILRPQYDLNIVVDRNGYVNIDEDRNGNRRNNRDRNDGDYRNRNDRDDDYNRNRDQDRDHPYDKDNSYDRDRSDNNRNYGRNENYERGRQWNDNRRVISDADFNQLTQKIRNPWFSKLNTAKDGLNSNYFTTYQVGQVIQIFSSENDRLELAKLAYNRTTDQKNFSQLYDQFSSNGRAELDRYVRSQY